MSAVRTDSRLDEQAVHDEFPILDRETRPGVPLVYLDSAATSQKPRSVIEAVSSYYRHQNANIHRGIHQLAEEATLAYERARQALAAFIGIEQSQQLVFTRNTTESINLVAQTWGRANLKSGDMVLLTEMEHHSNLVPWYMLADELGLELAFVPVTSGGLLDLEAYSQLLDEGPKLVSFVHVSNVLGTINPAAEMTAQAHAAGAVVLIDAAQSVPHMPIDVSRIDPDFLAFSGHKMCGPTGIGVLYGRMGHLESMPPYMGGGEMIKRVGLGQFEPNDVPHKFEAGTPAIAQAIGLGAAVAYLEKLGMEAIHAHERALVKLTVERLEEVPGVEVLGPPADQRGGVAAFTFDDLHPHDIAQVLDRSGVAVRAGHHCAMPLHEKLEISASTRASLYLYNTADDIDRLIDGLYQVKQLFS